MPLPAALLARLAKRGIVEQTVEKNPQKKAEEEEEVFAEDYDDPSKPDVPEEEHLPEPIVEPPPQILPQPGVDVVGQEPIFHETTACPNRQNPFHTCVPYCRKRYGLRDWKPESDMLKRRERMLRKYPLPEGWLEVGDHDSSRFYYWNMHTDDVSWLSPTHPKAKISLSAEQLGLVGKIGDLDSDGEENMETQSLPEERASDSGSDTSLSDEEEMEKETKIESRFGSQPPHLTHQSRQNESRRVPNRARAEDIDPMDPAAYSDIERGGWSDGLDMRGKAKTGVDVTASGPLFQQRPYPSPGDILRANQSLKKKK